MASRKRTLLTAALALIMISAAASAQVITQIENFEFAVTDAAAAAGIIDITDPENSPTFYINGDGPDEGGASEGQFSLGTDALFGASGNFVPGSFIGFRRQIGAVLFPTGQVDLLHAYGDPSVPGPTPADLPLSDLVILGDFYGSEEFGEGLTGTHLWVNLIDAEGERFNFVNYSEFSLFRETYTLDIPIGAGMVRIDPTSLVDVPNGDRLLTEIVAFEIKIQDEDNPPTGQGKWYVDNLRIDEPEAADVLGDGDGDGDVDLFDLETYHMCLTGPDNGPPTTDCMIMDIDQDGDVDFSDFAGMQFVFTGGF
jgi:hypothetical protein